MPTLIPLLVLLASAAPDAGSLPPTVLFELLNEPNAKLDAQRWNAAIPKLLAVIRPQNPHRGPSPVEVPAALFFGWGGGAPPATQPFCDGSHKGSGISPLKYHAEQSDTLYFCGCKHTQTPPCCDGSHNRL